MSPPFFHLHDLAEATSTSDLARAQLNLAEVPLPFVVRARRQTAGRGRGDHQWWSDEGSLTFTLGLDPEAYGLQRHHEPRLALAVATGLLDVVEAVGIPGRLSIRWPNDLEANGKKLGGILPERVDTPAGARLLIGIGLNVSTRLEEAPREVREMATSVELLGGSPGTERVFQSILETLPSVIARLASDDPLLAARWRERDALRGVPIHLKIGTRIETGIGGGITEDGGLILVTSRGEDVSYGGQVLR